MKGKISISLFFSSILVCLCIGIVIGHSWKPAIQEKSNLSITDHFIKQKQMNNVNSIVIHDEPITVSATEDKITADTSYLILEKNVNTGEIVTKRANIPEKYIGLTREQVIEHLSDYEANPPLIELENGFIGLEMISFSPQQLEVQMNYQEITPVGIFYIMAYNNRVVVMLEDKKTVYLSTDIYLTELPSEIQQDVMRGLFMPNEECLYDFLETYTS